jgi:hypothetical protein
MMMKSGQIILIAVLVLVSVGTIAEANDKPLAVGQAGYITPQPGELTASNTMQLTLAQAQRNADDKADDVECTIGITMLIMLNIIAVMIVLAICL